MKSRTSLPTILSVVLMSMATTHGGDALIDFETYPLPDGTLAATFDNQEISDQYNVAPFWVKFSQLEPGTDTPARFPTIAKVGFPLTAFQGCTGDDTPLPPADQPDGKELGDSFLTFSTPGVPFDLLIVYTTPVSQASGVLIDTDCRACPDPCDPCEQWTITARNAAGSSIDCEVIDALRGEGDDICSNPRAGPGDALAIGWSCDVAPQEIWSILIEYTGDPGTGFVGIAFDNFNTSGLPPPPAIPTVSAWGWIVLALLLLTGIKIKFGGRRSAHT